MAVCGGWRRTRTSSGKIFYTCSALTNFTSCNTARNVGADFPIGDMSYDSAKATHLVRDDTSKVNKALCLTYAQLTRPLTMLLLNSRRGDGLRRDAFLAYCLLPRHSEMRFVSDHILLKRRGRTGTDPEYQCSCLMLCRPCNVCAPSTSIAQASKEASCKLCALRQPPGFAAP